MWYNPQNVYFDIHTGCLQANPAKLGGTEMSFFSAIGHGFQKLFGWVKDAVQDAIEYATKSGLTDELVNIALGYAQQAETQYVDNAQKQAFVLNALTSKGIPTALANLAIELAVQLIHKGVADAQAAAATLPPAPTAPPAAQA